MNKFFHLSMALFACMLPGCDSDIQKHQQQLMDQLSSDDVLELSVSRIVFNQEIWDAVSNEKSLISVSIEGQISSDGIRAISSLSNLRVLDLSNCIFEVDCPAAMPDIAKLTQLGVLSLHSCKLPAGSFSFLSRMDNIFDLSLSKTRINDDSFSFISHLAKIESLNVSHCSCGPAFYKKLVQFPLLRKLSVSGTQFDDDCIESLVSLAELRVLEMADTRITDAGALHLSTYSRIEDLVITGTKITSEGLRAIAKVPFLQRLHCSPSQFSKTTMDEFQRIRPSVIIEYDDF